MTTVILIIGLILLAAYISSQAIKSQKFDDVGTSIIIILIGAGLFYCLSQLVIPGI